MTRTVRMTLAVGVVLLLGLWGLVWLAGRYRELAARRPVPEEAAALPQAAGGEEVATETLVARFIEARQRVNETIEARRVLRWLDPETGNLRGDVSTPGWMRFHDLLGELKIVWHEACAEAGIEEQAYVRVRTAFRQWMAGESVEDAALRRAFEKHADQLRALHLGKFEFLDGGRPSPQLEPPAFR